MVLICRQCHERVGPRDVQVVPGQEGATKRSARLDRVCCPRCSGRLLIESPLFGHVATTYQKTKDGYCWIDWRESRDVSDEELARGPWVFADGASSGSFAAVVMTGPNRRLEDHVRHGERQPTKNVSSELMAVVLGLRHAPAAPGGLVHVVCDFLGTACWFSGRWAVRCAHTFRRLAAIAAVVEERDLDVRFIHTKGHLRDDSDLTRYNNRADRLCADRPKDGESLAW